MKIAICLFGGIGTKESLGRSTNKKFQDIEYLEFKTPLESLNKFVIEPNKCDVFIHSWSIEKENEISKILNPKKTKFENFKTFSEPFHSRKNHIWSRFYTGFQSNLLKLDYELKNNFQYDVVMSCRMDLLWFNEITLKRNVKNTIYASHWNGSVKDNMLGPYDKNNHGIGWGVIDPWFFSSSKNMDKFTNIYNKKNFVAFKSYFKYMNISERFKKLDFRTNNYYISTHHFYHQHAINNKLDFNFAYYRGLDYELYRHTLKPGWDNSFANKN